MKKLAAGVLSVLFISFATLALSGTEPRWKDSRGSYDMVLENPSTTFIVDVRTRVEYEFVGHPDFSNVVPNMSIKFWPGWEMNKDFVKKVEERFTRGNTLITMCRSGERAKFAAGLLFEAGFKNVYYMNDSFEGPKDAKGLRTVGGWKVNGLPYTYRLDPALVYK